MTTAQTFDAAYIASKDPRIQKLFIGTCNQPGSPMEPTLRLQTATALALQSGLIVDPDIDARGMDPYLEYSNLLQQGFVRKFAIGEKPVLTAPPGLTVPGLPPYDPNAGKIVLSLDLANFPPFPVQPAEVQYIGAYAGNGLYNAINGAEKVFSQGAPYTEEPYLSKGMTFAFYPAIAIGEYFWQVVS